MRYLMIGGTGTLGRAFIDHLRKHDETAKIRVFSRDELKQRDMRNEGTVDEFVIGDIRDYTSIKMAMADCQVVCHFAAMKHIDIVEENPLEGIRTNVMGTENVAHAAIHHKVDHVIFSSTDKAVLPINVYGMTKAISERFLLDMNKKQTRTHFSVFRWGNIIGSRGSAIPMFVDKLRAQQPIPLTHKEMTRFWLRIEDAAAFVYDRYREPAKLYGGIHIPPCKGASVARVIDALAFLDAGTDDHRIEIVGVRPGEKLHECLYTSHDYCLRSDTCAQYSENELYELLQDFV